MKEWDYAQLAKTASEHGGPQKYIDEVADTNFSLGFNHGHDSGVKDGFILDSRNSNLCCHYENG
ncbi:hypothetical protein [Candidatus Weimeria sp. HCP3S3_B5]|uniref:hypothetical protein n=1 Tax=Candidatus Weimeria sp. HCP3S3_B5 TaxID=3438871 RepID=UPI003F8B3E34